MKPLISVLIPVYGVEKYIEKCLTSLFENMIADKCEFILVNDCTKDNSIQIARTIINSFPNLDVKIIEHDKNCGIAATRNTALKNASGNYIIYVDSDDWVEKDFLKKMYDEAEKKSVDITFCDWYEERGSETNIFSHDTLQLSNNILEEFLKSKIPAYTWNKLINRNLITENAIEFEPGINNWEDETICLKLFSLAKSFAYINLPLYHYQIRNGSYIRCLITEKTKNDFLNSISTMTLFFERPELEPYRDLLNIKKNHAKQKILIDGTRQMQKKYLSLWPESYPYIKQDATLPSRVKIILRTAKTAPFISKILLFIHSSLKIVLRHQFTWKQYFSKSED